MSPKAAKRTSQKHGKMIDGGKTTQIYTRLDPKDAERLRVAAANDDRPVMTYLRRLIVNHLDELEKE